MAPLRVGLIGLSSSAITSWASSAHLPALLSESGKSHYTITALLNSSVAAAHAAIEQYKLPASTKAYGNPQDLADDDDIDVVIVNTRVDKHYETVLPSVKKGKLAVVEWPIGANVEQAETLFEEARKSGGRVAIVLQGRWAPPVLKLKDLLEGKAQVVDGGLGKLLSSNVRAWGGAADRSALPPGLAYFADKKIGGNPVTIGLAHMIDSVQSVTGNLEPATTQARLQLQRPHLRIRHSASDPNAKDEEITTNVPDLITIHGSVPETPHVAKDATLSVYFRRGSPFKGEPAFVWYLNFERGEVRLTAPAGPGLQVGSDDNPPWIEVHDFAKDSVAKVDWEWPAEQKVLPVRARGVQSVLVAFAEGRQEGYVSLEDALGRARQIWGWLDSHSAEE